MKFTIINFELSNGKRNSSKCLKAFDLLSKGHSIQIISEEDFFKLL